MATLDDVFGNKPIQQQQSTQSYADLYNKIVAANQQAQQQEIPQVSAPQLQGWYQNNPEQAPVREMNALERGLTGLSDWGENLMGITGWDPEKGFTPENIARFAVGLPFQMVGGLASAPAQGYEAAVGTNILDRPNQEGQAYQYELDPNQRLAQLGNFAINGPAMFVGGSARALGTAGKFLTGGKIADTMARGRIGQMMQGATKGQKIAGQIVGDVAEEAGEEFGQSFLDDTRWNTWDDQSMDRALQGAAWGALGGGLFSGAAHGANALWDKAKQHSDGNATIQTTANSTDSLYEYQKNKAERGYTDATDYIAQELLERQRRAYDQPASSSLMNVQVDNRYDLMSGAVGDYDIAAMFDSNVDGARKKLANAFRTDEATLASILRSENREERVDKLKALIERIPEKHITVVVGRNPDTNAAGLAKLDITEIFSGSGIRMNRDAYSLFGADLDGDRTQVYFDSDTRPWANRYLTEVLSSGIVKRSNLDIDYATMMDTDPDGFYSKVKQFAEEQISAYRGLGESKELDSFMSSKEEFDNVVNDPNSSKDDKFTHAYKMLSDLRTRIASKQGDYIADKAISKFLHDLQQEALEKNSETIIAHINDAIAKNGGDASLSESEMAEIRMWNQQGNFPAGADYSHIAPLLAREIFSRTGYTNVLFRQSSGDIMRAHTRNEVSISSLISQVSDGNAYDFAITWGLGLEQFGEDVDELVNGMRIMAIQDEFFRRFEAKKINSGNLAEAVDLLRSIYNEETDKMAESLKKQTSEGLRYIGEEALSSKLKKEDGLGSPAFARAFEEVFGKYLFTDIFDITGSTGELLFEGLSLDAVLKLESTGLAGSSRNLFAEIGGDANRLWNSLLENEGSRARAVSKSIEKQCEENVELMRQNRAETLYSNNGSEYVVNEESRPVLEYIVQGWQRILGAPLCLDLNLGTVTGFINTTWGRKLLEADADSMKSAYVSLKLSWQYRNAIELAMREDCDSADVKAQIQLQLDSLAGNSFLHALIAEKYRSSGDLLLLKGMTDLDASFKDKSSVYDYFDSSGVMEGCLLSDVLVDSLEGFDVSKVSNSLKQARRDFATADDLSLRRQRQLIKQMREEFFEGPNSSADTKDGWLSAMRSFASDSSVHIMSDIIGATIFSHRFLSSEDRAKGNVRDEVSIMAQSIAEAVNGGNFSLIDEISAETGSVSLSRFSTNRVQILGLIFGDIDEITVYDETETGRLTMTREGLLSELGIDANLNKADQVLRIFEECPNLISLVQPQLVVPYSAGGAAGIKTGTRKSDFINEIKDRSQELKNSPQRDVGRKLRHKALMMAMNNPSFYHDLILSMPDSITEKTGTMPECCRAVESAVERYIDRALYEAFYTEGSAKDNAFIVDRNFNAALRMLNLLGADIDSLALSSVLLQSGDNDQEMYGRIFQTAYAMDQKERILNDLSSVSYTLLGIDGEESSGFPNIESPLPSKTEIKEDLKRRLDVSREDIMLLLHSTVAMLGQKRLADPSLVSSELSTYVNGLINTLEMELESSNLSQADKDAIRKDIDRLDKVRRGDVTSLFDKRVLSISPESTAVTGEMDIPFTEDDFELLDGNSLVIKLESLISKYPGLDFAMNEKGRAKLLSALQDYGDNSVDYKLSPAGRAKARSLLIEINGKLTRFALNRLLSASGFSDLNEDFLPMEIAAMDDYNDFVSQLRNSIPENEKPGRVEYVLREGKGIPGQIVFSARNSAKAMMASQCSMNMGGANIATGISVNGSKTKIVGALALIRDGFFGDRLQSEYFTTPSSSFASKLGLLVERLCNTVQEPMFLKLKKAMNLPSEIIRKVYVGRYSTKSEQIDQGSFATEPRTYMRSLLEDSIDNLSKALRKSFSDAGIWDAEDGGEIAFSEENFHDLAMLMIPYFDIEIDPFTGSDGVEYSGPMRLNASRLFGEDQDELSWMPGWLKEAYDNGKVSFVRPRIVGLEELSLKILREEEAAFYSGLVEKTPTSSDFCGVAERAISEWETDGSLTYRSVLGRINPRSYAPYSPAVSSSSRTAAQRWAELHGEKLFRMIEERRHEKRFKQAKVEDNKSTNERAWAFRQTAGGTLWNNRVAASFTVVGRGAPSLRADAEFTDKIAVERFNSLTNHALPDISDAGTTPSILSGDKESFYRAVDIVYAGEGSDQESLLEIASISWRNNRELCLNRRALNLLGFDADAALAKTMFEGLNSIRIGSEDFWVVSPSLLGMRSDLSSDIPTMYQGRYGDPVKEISFVCGLGGQAGLANSATFARPGLDAGVRIESNLTVDPRKILGGRNPILKAGKADISDIRSAFDDLRAHIDDESYAESRMDLHAYVGKPNGLSKEALLSYMDSFLKEWEANQDLDLETMFNVKQDSCIGFMKTKRDDGQIVYAPLFYGGSVPKVADCVKVSLAPNGTDVRISYLGQAPLSSGTNKMFLDGMFYKTTCSMFNGELNDWFHIRVNGDEELQTLFQTPHYITDEHSLTSRLMEVSIPSLFRNLAKGIQVAGGNLLFEKRNGAWVKKSDLNEGIDFNLEALIAGDSDEWLSLARAGVFAGADNTAVNQTILSIVKTVLDLKGNPAWIFFPTVIRADGVGFKDCGKLGAKYDYMMVFKRFRTDPDSILAVFNKMNDSFCYASTQESINDPDNNEGKLLDHWGRLWLDDRIGADPNGKPIGRVPTVIGENYFFGDTTSEGAPSRRASISYQHVVKEMMRDGVYPEAIKRSLMQWALSTDVIDPESGVRLPDSSGGGNIERISAWLKTSPAADSPYKARALAALSMGHPTSANRAWLTECRDVANRLTKPLSFVKDDKKSPLTEADEEAWRQIDLAVDRWNSALGITGEVRYTWKTMSEWVRSYLGFYENDGQGYSSLTVGQFTNAVDGMIKNIEKGLMPITPESFHTGGGKQRVRIAAVTRGGFERIYALSPRIRSIANADGFSRSSLDNWIDATIENSLRTTVEKISELSSEAQKTALKKMVDATAISCIGKPVSGFIDYSSSLYDIIHAGKEIASSWMSGYDPELVAKYDELQQLSTDYVEGLKRVEGSRKVSRSADNNYAVFRGDHSTIVTYILRALSGARKLLGTLGITMPAANIIERLANQGMQSLTLQLGQVNVGPYAGKVNPLPKGFTKQVSESEDLRKVFSAFRTAELAGVGQEFLYAVGQGGNIDEITSKFMSEMGLVERWANMMTNIVSGKDVAISGMIRNFLDYFAIHAEEHAPWWLEVKTQDGKTMLEAALREHPAKWFVDVISGVGTTRGPDVIFANQALNWAKRGDMAQRNVVSAIYSEIARRSPGIEFLTTTLISPYFQYATNRMGRILQWIAPISSIHYLVVNSMTNGKLKDVPAWGTGVTFGELGLDTVQLNADLREAMAIDMMHLGPVLVAFMLVGMAGGIEPPDDEDKWGNFKEWTILGIRLDEAWWIEDTLGLALPMAMFMRSGQLGKPRTDIIINGIAYYLNNNPVTKVADAVAVLFDPFEELYKDYDSTLDSFAKAFGGPPSMSEMVQGKMTSFGLSYVSQFFTPLFLREIYNAAQEYETSYKRIYEEGATGKLTQEAVEEGKTQMTTYRDAMVRKYTRNNPVMGFLADALLNPNTGYMAHEMPRTVYYDPYQMNSIQAFSLYNDPYTKTDPKTEQEKQAIAYEVIKNLQEYSVEELSAIGFMLDSETRAYVSECIWDNIATLNNQFYQLQQSGQLNYYQAGDGDYALGEQRVSELKQAHYSQVEYWKSLYYDKLWADELTNMARYNRRHTRYAQDADGEWYATGYYPEWFTPITLGPDETQGDYQYVMSRENDWATESVVNGLSTGERGLIPIDSNGGKVPDISSWSSDGSDTGHSNTWNANHPGAATTPSGASTTGSSGGYGSYGGYRSSGGSGGGGGGGGTPNIYSRATVPNANNAATVRRTNNRRADYDYLRPNFETKGSREAYKRGDI